MLQRSQPAGSWPALTALFGGLAPEVRQAARSLLKRPRFSAIAVATLAVAIGANAAMFALVDRLILQQLPVREPNRLAIVSSRNAIGSRLPPMWTAAVWEEMRQQVGGNRPTECFRRRR
jgi:hypothetical protein